MDVDMNDARAEAADVIALDDPSMAVEADDDATPGSLFHGAQIVATDEDDHERPASPADASAAPAEDPIAMDGSDGCLLYTSPSPRDATLSRMPSSA